MKKIYFYLILGCILNTSFGQIGPKHQITRRTPSPKSGIICDINADGSNDVLVASSSKISWYGNTDGNGLWGVEQIIDDNIEEYCYVNVADLDGDGDIDLIATSHDYLGSNVLAWYENIDGLGSFGDRQIISTEGDHFLTPKTSDIDNDGDLDILTSSISDNKICWYENTDGLGNFGAQQIISAEINNPMDIYPVDINNDGYQDVLSYSFNDSTLIWFENSDGLGNFDNSHLVFENNVPIKRVFPKDIDGDSDIDLFIVLDNTIKWLENMDGLGDFSEEHLIYTSEYSLSDLLSFDIDNDSDFDLVYISHNGVMISWFENTDGLGNFQNSQAIDADYQDYSSSFSGLSSGDIDNDGYQDLISLSSSHDKVSWYKYSEDENTYENRGNITAWVYNLRDLYYCDIDGDNDIDVLSNSYYDHDVNWYRNMDHKGNFGSQLTVSSESNNGDKVIACDLDSDGDNDVISTSALEHYIAWYENLDGLGNFGPQHIIDSSGYTENVFSCDIDSDNDNDIIVNYGHRIKIFENINENDAFIIHQTIELDDWSSNALYCSDIDTDGDLDIISTFSDNDIAWYENLDGLGNFGEHITISEFVLNLKTVISSDLDGDGDMDVVSFSYDDEKIAWYKNLDGLGNFGEQIILASESGNPEYLNTADFDDDGDLDIIYSGYYGNTTWLENIDGQGSFQQNSVFPIIQCSYLCDMDNDGDLDLLGHGISWYENMLYGAHSKIQGNFFFDSNQNGINDSTEQGFALSQLVLNPNAVTSYTNYNGKFWFSVWPGNYVLNYQAIDDWELTTPISQYNVSISDEETTISDLNFGFYPSNFNTSINPQIIASPSRCSEEINYWISFQNQGTTQPDGVLELILDTQITYISSIVNPDSIIDNKIYWHFDSLNFFTSDQIQLFVEMPDFNSMGDILSSTFNIYTSDSTGNHFYTDTLAEELVCAYDPNDKYVYPKGIGEEGLISQDETLEYTIRFQNTGNASAINVKIRDQIDQGINLESIKILASSHDVYAYQEANNWMVFQFDNIMLADSNANELESHGFIRYSAQLKEDVTPNASILNTAEIYFDYNSAIVTNTVQNTVECYIQPEIPLINYVNSALFIATVNQIQWYFNGIAIADANNSTLEINENGEYSVIVTDENGCFSESEIFTATNIEILNFNKFDIFPNPSSGVISIEGLNIQMIKIFNNKGDLVKVTQHKTIDLKDQVKGIYMVKIITSDRVISKKLILI